MIQAIVFDYGQTLVDSSAGFRTAEKQARETLSNLLPRNDDSFAHHYREVRSRFHAASNFSRVAMWRETLAPYYTSIDTSQLERLEQEYWQQVRDHTRLFSETLPVLRHLKKKYRLAIISNTQGEHRTAASKSQHSEGHRLFSHSGLSEMFEHVIIAGENGIPAKPHSKPFELCLQKLGLQPEQMLYIGDDWHKDLLGASGCGIRALWLQHSSVSRNWPTDAASHNATVITSLEPLLDATFIHNVPHICIHHQNL